MAAVLKEAVVGPRYAPPDPTLPKPWRALIDGTTGNTYFWNPETKITQYDRPCLPPIPLSITSPHENLPEEKGNGSHAQESPGPEAPSNNNHNVAVSVVQNQVGTGPAQTPIQSEKNEPQTPVPVANAAQNQISADAYRRLHEIIVMGKDVPAPYVTFESTPLPPGLIRELYKAGFKAPTAIQAQSWPIAMQRKDIIAVAKTGSGKTLGFLIPGFIHLKRLQNDPKSGPTVLVLSPTRELATQIQDESFKFGAPAKITTTCLYGGAPKGPQIRDIERGVDVVIATPGRLNDILEMRKLSLQQVSYLVLDEADRMLDMGFEPQIRKIAANLPERRQTLMFTATWPVEVRKIANLLLTNPVQVNIGNTQELAANKSITQHVEVMTPMEKRKRLEQILRSQEPNSKVIIFCSTKRMCDMLARNLEHEYGAAAIHGDKSQAERDSVLSDFRSGRSQILVATDVAARGLDIKDIKAVINYDFPNGVEDYVHRIGRTGRAGATGTAFTFFSDQDGKHAADLVKILDGANQKVPPELKELAGRGGYGARTTRWGSGGGGGGGGGYKSSGGSGGYGGGGGYKSADGSGGFGGSTWGSGSGGGGGSSWGGGGGGGAAKPWGNSSGGGGGASANTSSWGGGGGNSGGGGGTSWGGSGGGGGGGGSWGGGSGGSGASTWNGSGGGGGGGSTGGVGGSSGGGSSTWNSSGGGGGAGAGGSGGWGSGVSSDNKTSNNTGGGGWGS